MVQNTFTVTQLNSRIKVLLESETVLSGVFVKGELSNYKIYPSGHHYFTLKDTESSIRCVMFKNAAAKLRFRPESGMGVVVYGSVSVYLRDGAYQLNCTRISPDGTGDLHVAFEQLKAKLASEGLFDPRYKKPIPRYPRRIAVITSSAGAAVRDIIRVLGSRWPVADVLILPVRVQGTEAPAEIAGALRFANKHRIADTIITGRGGGSIEDLWAFNDERVARGIFESEIPVISAVGHEPDVTIADFVADLRAATPSNAAELAVPDQSELREYLAACGSRSLSAIRKYILQLRARLTDISQRRVMQSPAGYIDARRMELDFIRERLTAASRRYLTVKRESYIRLAASLDALSPLAVIARGYSIPVGADGSVIRRVEDAEVGSEIGLIMSGGRLDCRVEGKILEVDRDAKEST